MAIRRTVLVYASITATANAAAQITVPARSKLKAVKWSIVPGAGLADGDFIRAELSVNAAGQDTTNDATGILSVAGTTMELTTSGASAVGVNEYHPVDVQFNGGDRIYLHCVESGAATWQVKALLYFE